MAAFGSLASTQWRINSGLALHVSSFEGSNQHAEQLNGEAGQEGDVIQPLPPPLAQ